MLHEIFIVEDEPAVCFFYKQALSLNGYKIIGIAEDGEEAVSMFKTFKEKPIVILMDHRMPKKDGIEALKEILLIDQKVNIIFVSANDEIRKEALENGAFSFQKKPVKVDDLLEEIKRAIKMYTPN